MELYSTMGSTFGATLAHYLKTTRSGHYFRTRVPHALAVVIARTELVIPLRANSRREARLQAATLAARADALFKELAKLMAVEMDETAIRAAVDTWLANEWRDIERDHVTRSRPYDEREHDEKLEELAEFIGNTREALGTGDMSGVYWAVDAIFEQLGVPVDRESLAYRRACRQYNLGWLELFERQREMLLGRTADPSGTSASTAQGTEVAPKVGPKMSTLIADYLKDREEGGRANKWTIKDKIEKSLAEFVEVIGDLPVNTIEYEHMKRFRDLMQRLPTKRTVRPAYRSKTVPELLAMDIPAEIRMSGETVSQHVGRLSTFFEWCIKSKRRTLVTENPAKGLEIKTQKRDRAPLSSDDLRKLFSSDYYTGNGRRACYVWWLPLLGIYTGARISELVSIRCEDVYEQDGVPLIRIRGTKTENAARVVAVHSKLVELGFMRFVDEVRRRGKLRVLFDAPLGTRTPGKRASEMVMRVIRGAGISSTDKVFHSTRHLVNQELVEGSQNLVVLQAMMGHAPTNVGMTANYFDAARTKPVVLKQAIEVINYGVDLSHLTDGWRRFVP